MTRDELRAALQHPNVAAFLRVVREGESSQDDNAYRVMYGGGYFSSFADHPRQKHTAHGITSTAAGCFQFLEKTWDGLVAKYGFPDFSPASQDEAAVALIHGRGALQDLLRGDLSEVLDKCSWEWASLPPFRYSGQGGLDAKRVYATYEKWLHPAAAPVQTATPEKPIMPAPFLLLAFEALTTLLPTLIRFKSKSATGEANAQLAEKVMPVIQAAVGAANAQEAVEKIMNDPAALQQADKAVQDNYYGLIEVGGGIEAARDYSLQAADKPLRKQPAFIVSIVLLLFPLLLCIDVFVGHPGYYTPEMKTQVITAILVVLSMVGAFWLGSSQSSRNKDDALARAVK
jgi:muramidase (phage lysozyme)